MTTQSSFLSFEGKEIIEHLDDEWLIGNGLGSYASGSVGGALLRRYHAAFICATQPPLGRRVFVSKIEEILTIDGVEYPLSNNYWGSESNNESPKGYRYLSKFYLDDNIPTWIYKCANTEIEKKIFMPRYEDSVYTIYRVLSTQQHCSLIVNVFVNDRDYHSLKEDTDFALKVTCTQNGVSFSTRDQKIFYIQSNVFHYDEKSVPYHGYFLPIEHERGFPARENHLLALTLQKRMTQGECLNLVCSTQENVVHESLDVYDSIKERNHVLLSKIKSYNFETPAWIKHLAITSSEFIVKRRDSHGKISKSILAGFHWFGDWGRDTMISISGLCCVLGRYSTARDILYNYSTYANQGMLPNRFPDYGENPDYNSVDAGLWFFEAIRVYLLHTQDTHFLKKIFPCLLEMIDWHIQGTRHKIHCDLNDGLIYAGEKGVQLTWMDAKIGDYVVTPRTGKAIEISALWINALASMQSWGALIQQQIPEYISVIYEKASKNFGRFWNPTKGYCYDLIDGPNGEKSELLRPNQLIPLIFESCPLTIEQKQSVIKICQKELLTPYGMRSLAPFEKAYTGHYQGNFFTRDSAYHQGTAWGWLLGIFTRAHFKVHKNKELAFSFLAPIEEHMKHAGLGFISEIFDANAPFKAAGCMAQAWSSAEILHAWYEISSATLAKP